MAAGFMAGFGTTMAKLIENDREYFRDRAAKRQEYLQTYGTRAVTDRQDKAAQSMSVLNSLITAGVPKEDVRYVLDKSGIQGLAQLKATIDSRTDLTPEERTTLVKKASDYVAENKGEDLETVINRAWGLYKSSDDPVQRERNIFSAMLGLDANMMEEDVLDDLYVNGYSGRDIYRIMGTSGPKPGEALDLNLPAKPPSDRKMAFAMTSLENQFEAGIDSAIKVLEGEQAELSKNDTVALEANFKKRRDLEILKGQGVNGWATWAKTNPSFYEYAKSLEDTQAGVVTRNLAMRPFIPAYRDFFEEAQDEAKMAAGAGDSTTTVPTVTTTPPGGGDITLQTGNAVMEFETTAEFNTAAAAGNIPAGASVQIGGGAVQTFSPPEAKPETTGLGDMSVDTSMTDTSSLAGIADASGLVAKTTSALEKGQATRKFIAEAIPEAGSVVSVTANAVAAGIDAFAAAEDFTAGLFGYEESTLGGTLTTPERSQRYRDFAQSMRNQAEEVFTMGFSEYMRSLTGKEVPEAVVAEVKENLDTDALILRAFDTEANQGLLSYIRAAQRRAYKPASSEESDEKPIYTIAEIKSYAENRLGAREKQAMEDRIRDDARQFLQDEKSFPQPLPTIIVEKLENDIVEEAKVDVEVMRIVQQLDKKGETPSRKDIEDLKTALELNQEIDTETQELYRGPISGKTLPEKLDDIYNFYTGEESEYNPRAIGTVGSRDLGLRDTTDDVRDRQNQPADLQMSVARGPSPTEDSRFFDSTKNMTVENLTTRGRRQTPTGLMSRPSVEAPPQLGSAEFNQLIKRVHGSSKAAKDFGNKISSGKLTTADVARMIKATDKLPNTKTKDQLLLSLYDLRDSLNKR